MGLIVSMASKSMIKLAPQSEQASNQPSPYKASLTGIIRQLLQELHPARQSDITPASRLDRDLGIDSLGRAGLVLRIEQAFHVRLPSNTLTESETVQDLLLALGQATSHAIPLHSAEFTPPTLPQVSNAESAQTLTGVLDWHAARHPDRLHATVLNDDGSETAAITYGELQKAARQIAANLIDRDIQPNDCVALMLPTGTDFFTSFFGILYAGATPVPIYPPARMSQLEEHLLRQAGILRNATVQLLLTTDRGLSLAGLIQPQVPSLRGVESVATLSQASPSMLPLTNEPSATAFLQYTSGSTGDPKGVVLSHANLLANIRSIGQAVSASSADVFVSWLPLYHDMGLIGAWLGSLYFAAPFYAMSPLTFLARPERWLWAIHRYRATISAAPNFAFETCHSKISDADIEGLDLSSLRIVANGAEPVSPNSIRRFAERFSKYGFRAEAMAPAYGLAENTVVLTFPPLGRGPLIERLNRKALSSTGLAQQADPDDSNPLEIVSSGRTIPDHNVRIVDDQDCELQDRHVGRLQFRGPSATSGYFNNEAKTKELFHDGWLDSGDLAYRADGEYFITGRAKDIVIRAGKHIYPHEVEEKIAELPGVIKSGVALFGTADRLSGTERAVILVETAEQNSAARESLIHKAHATATESLGAPADEIMLVLPDTIPKTASGKIRRSAAKALYENGEIGAPRRSVAVQQIRLFLAGLMPRIGSWLRATGRWIYAAWWWLTVGTVAASAWIVVMTLPVRAWRWAALRLLCRTGLFAIGAPLTVQNLDRIPKRDAILIFNHASYADALVLGAALPGEPVFAAKKEFLHQIFAGPFLRRLGVVFVERRDIAGSLADTEAVVALAREGRPLVFFPEGTFTRRIGLTGFHLGAFKIASEAGLAVIPGTIRGTRQMLRGERWFPIWSPVSVIIGEPVRPTGKDFASILKLRDECRAVILRNSQEPDLDELVMPPPA